MNRRTAGIIIGVGGFLLFIFDRWLKIASAGVWAEPKIAFGWIGWSPSINRGAAFGLSLPLLLIIILSIILIAVITAFAKRVHDRTIHCGVFLILFGALSNLYDRVYYGHTFDYFFVLISVFNLADVLIVAGAVICFFTLLKKPTSTDYVRKT